MKFMKNVIRVNKMSHEGTNFSKVLNSVDPEYFIATSDADYKHLNVSTNDFNYFDFQNPKTQTILVRKCHNL